MTQRQRTGAEGTAAAQDPRDNLGNLTGRHASRAANGCAAFFLPYLRPGMGLLDCGCGPGSITLGLAEAVAPGQVIGIDLDPKRVERAKKAAAERRITNGTFQVADIYDLPFPEDFFDAVFENQVFIHLPDPLRAAEAISHVLKPGGLFGARDTDHDYTVRMNAGPLAHQFFDTVHKWWLHTGSNHYSGKHHRSTLRQTGFQDVVTTASNVSYGTSEEMTSWADNLIGYLDEPEFLQVSQEQGWADAATFESFREAIKKWAADTDSYGILLHCEVVGSKL